MLGEASQAGEAESPWAPDLTSGLHENMIAHRGTMLFVWQYVNILSYLIFEVKNNNKASNSVPKRTRIRISTKSSVIISIRKSKSGKQDEFWKD